MFLSPHTVRELVSPDRQEVLCRIAERKRQLAGDLLILCHHYQQDAVYRFADLSGDSLKLSRDAAAIVGKKYLVFCGVHFMAEAASILGASHQVVILPHAEAGCPMADMATRPALESAWRELREARGRTDERIVPITYVNSSAEVKAFVGERGGSVCTSSNGQRVLAWALQQGDLAFFFPDQHLGRNCADALGTDPDQVVLWRRGEPLGGCSRQQLGRARVVLWDGYCDVHMRCFPEHIQAWRALDPRVRVMVHPECRNEVVRLADLSGSTEGIIAAVEQAAPGTHWVIGTEVNLVERLAVNHPEQCIDHLAPACLCPTMAAISPEALLFVLDHLAEGRAVNQIKVPREVVVPARKALERMLAI